MNIAIRSAVVTATLVLIAGCGSKESADQKTAETQASSAAAEAKELNIYIWSDYLPESVVKQFETETGIKVRVDNYDSNETLEAKLLAGRSGYDLAVPTGNFMEKQIKAGVYQKLDKSKLTNLGNMDSDVMQRLQLHDAGNQHAVDYMWGTTGIGYNVDKVKKALPNAPVDSWRLVFDPEVVKHLKSCGVAVLDSSSEMIAMTLAYLGKDPNSQNPEDLKQVEEALMKIQPFIRYRDSSRYIGDLASGEICVAVGYNGDVLQARSRAEENKTGANVAYTIPKEGTIIWFDSMVIPVDAPHPGNAHAFINFMMRPENIAAASTAMHYANGNQAATAQVAEEVRNDPGVYPPAEIKAKLFPNLAVSDEVTRTQTRIWTRFSTGQ
jgi:putrescine transport system substrate-binding protein